jgi:hypothetical protein
MRKKEIKERINNRQLKNIMNDHLITKSNLFIDTLNRFQNCQLNNSLFYHVLLNNEVREEIMTTAFAEKEAVR